jgi:serine/threonine protein kinase
MLSKPSTPKSSIPTPQKKVNATQRKPQPTTQLYSTMKCLHSGAQGMCFRAMRNSTGQPVVLKIAKVRPNVGISECLIVENAALKQLHHPRIIHIYGTEPTYNNALVLEYAQQGDLMSFLLDRLKPKQVYTAIPEHLTKYLARQLIDALHYCSVNNIMHRDVKPENIFLDHNYCIKLGDFGLASTSNTCSKINNRPVGTEGYMAPEVHIEFHKNLNCDYHARQNPNLQQPCHQETSDIWSAGVVFFIMLYGVPPFGKMHETDWWYNKITKNQWHDFFRRHRTLYEDRMKNYKNTCCYPYYCSDLAKDLLQRMLCVDPLERIGFQDILKHPWFSHDNVILSDIEFGKKMKKLIQPIGLSNSEIDTHSDVDDLLMSKAVKPLYELQETNTIPSLPKKEQDQPTIVHKTRRCTHLDSTKQMKTKRKRRKLH